MTAPFPGWLVQILLHDAARDLRDLLDEGADPNVRMHLPNGERVTVLGEACVAHAHACVELLLARGADVDAPTRVPRWMRRAFHVPESALTVWELLHRTRRSHLLARHPRARWARVRDAVRVRPYALHWLEWHARAQEEARIARARGGVLDADAV